MKILVTGATGYLGNKIANFLEEKYLVDTVSRRHEEEHLKVSNQFIGELNDFQQYNQYDYIIHCAAARPNDCNDIEYAKKVNMDLTENIISKMKVDATIIYVSTQAVYGNEGEWVTEKTQTNPLTNYAKTKLMGEEVIRESGKKFIILRPSRFIGIGNFFNKDNIITTLFPQKIMKNDIISLFGNVNKKISLIDILDICNFIEWIIRGKIVNETYNLTGDYKTSVKEIVEEYKLLAKEKGIEVVVEKGEIIEDKNFTLSNEKAKDTGWSPKKNLQQSLREILEMYLGD